MTYRPVREGQQTYEALFQRGPSRLAAFAFGVYASFGLGGCSSDSQQQYPLAQQQAQKQTSDKTVLLIYDRWSCAPFDPTNSTIQPPSYKILQQEIQVATDPNRKKSMQSALSFLDQFAGNYANINITGTALDHQLSATVMQRDFFPNKIVYCMPLGNYTEEEVKKIERGYNHVRRQGKEPVCSFRFDGKRLEEIVH